MAFRYSTSAALVLALTSLSAIALCKEPDDDEEIRRGVALRRDGRDIEALQAFQRVLARSPSPRARGQVALAEQSLALWLSAERDLNQALAEADDPWIRQNREALEQAARLVASKLAWILVKSAPDAQLLVNGVVTPAGPDGRIRVVAGEVVIEARAEGRAAATRRIQVTPEMTMKVAIEPGAALPARPQVAAPTTAQPLPSVPQTQGPDAARTVGWFVGGAGVVSLGVGGFFAVRAVTKKDERDRECQSGCTQIGVDADRAGRTAALVSTVTVVAGAAAAAVSVMLLLRSSGSKATPGLAVRWTGPAVVLQGSF